MDTAIKLSQDNILSNTGGPFGAVIIKNNNIIATGTNLVIKNNDPSAHAEIIAIRNACTTLNTIDLSDCILYSSCEPCAMCYGCIRWAKINHIYFANTRKDADTIGFSDKNIYDEIHNIHTNKKIDLSYIHIPNQKALDVFHLWDSLTTKQMY